MNVINLKPFYYHRASFVTTIKSGVAISPSSSSTVIMIWAEKNMNISVDFDGLLPNLATATSKMRNINISRVNLAAYRLSLTVN